MTTNSPRFSDCEKLCPFTMNGCVGLKLHWNRPRIVMTTNGAKTMTPNTIDESPMTFEPRMFNRVKTQITVAPSSHRATPLDSKILK